MTCTNTSDIQPRLLVYSSLFPNDMQPSAGLFIRERMFRVAQHCPLVVVSPKPWFPLQSLLRLVKTDYRPTPERQEIQDGVTVHFPRFLSLPGIFRGLDGISMALSSWWLLRTLKRQFEFNVIDSHFAYPDGYAATRLGKWLETPVTITLRGTEVPLANSRRCPAMITAMKNARHIFSVADSLKRHVGSLGVDIGKIEVVGNGVDTTKFFPVDRMAYRNKLGIDPQARVMISVGGLVERKGFHRVIECIPELLAEIPDLHYLIVGGASGEGDWTDKLEEQVADLCLQERVHFLGFLPPSELKSPLSSSDLFVLATRNEGWANVFLEALACGTPVVTTDVGGNTEVICSEQLGTIVPFGDKASLARAIKEGLQKSWDKDRITGYAASNSWDSRVSTLLSRFTKIVNSRGH